MKTPDYGCLFLYSEMKQNYKFYKEMKKLMSKRKMTEEEIESGVGEIEIDIDSLEVEEANDEQPVCFAADEEITGDEE